MAKRSAARGAPVRSFADGSSVFHVDLRASHSHGSSLNESFQRLSAVVADAEATLPGVKAQASNGEEARDREEAHTEIGRK